MVMLDLRKGRRHEDKFEEYSVEDCIAYLDGLTDVIAGELKKFAAVIQQLDSRIEDMSENDRELVDNWAQYLQALTRDNVYEASWFVIEDEDEDGSEVA